MADNVYDDTLEQIGDAPPKLPATVPNPYDDVIKAQDAGHEQRLRTSMIQTADASPDEAAAATKVAQSTGLPLEVVQRNLPAMQRRARIDETPFRAILQDTPTLASWAADPANAAVSHDDMENLGSLEWLVTMPARAISQSLNEQAYGALRTASMFRPLTQAETDQLGAYKFHSMMGGELGSGNSWFRGALTKSMKLLATLTAPEALPTAGGAAAGAVIGGVGGAIVGNVPGAIAGAVAGAKLGAEAGYTYGLGSSAFQTAAAASYDEYLGLTDAVGRKLDPDVAKAAALVNGAVNAGLMVFGGKAIKAGIDAGGQKISAALTKNAIKEALRQPSVAGAIGEMMKTYGVTLTEGTALMVAMKAADIITGSIANATGDHTAPTGQLEPGTVDLFKQPAVKNADGSTSTVDSFSVNIDGKEVLLPTVTPDGRHLSQDAALHEYAQTGRHLGKFDTPASADAFAKRLHEDYAAGKYNQPSVGRQLLTAAEEGVQSFALIGLAGPAMGLARSMQSARRAQQGTAFFQALGEGVAQSKTAQRLPDAAQAFIAQATKDGPIATVYAPLAEWTKYWQDKGVDPAEMATEITGSADAYANALKTGEDLAIPTSRYATKLAPTEHNSFFAQELRLAPDEMNGREAATLLEQMKTAGDQAAPDEAPSPVRAAVLEQLKGAGVPADTAEQYAGLYESAFTTLAERAGADPADLYESYGLTVQRPDLAEKAPPAGEAPRPEQPPLPTGAAGPVDAAGTPTGGYAGPERRQAEVESAAVELRRRASDAPLPVMADIVGAAAAMRAENPNIERDAAAMRAKATAAGRIEGPKGRKAKPTAVFLGYGPDGPLYNIVGGLEDRSTVSPARLEELGIQTPETPADTGEQLTGAQLRAKAMEARALVDKNAAGAQTTGDQTDAVPQPEESRAASRAGSAAGDRVAPSAPRVQERKGAGGKVRIVHETAAHRAERERVHFDDVFDHLLDNARAIDQGVDAADLRAEFEFRLNAWRELQTSYLESGHDPLDILRAVAKNGGLGPESAGGLTGELADLKSGNKFGAVHGIQKVFRAVRELDDRGQPKSGLGFDVMVQRLQQDPRFAWIENENMLIDAIDEAIRNPPAADTFPGTAELRADVQMDPRVAWWKNSWRPGNMLETTGLEPAAVDQGGPGDTSFNIEEFSQGLFDDLQPPDPTSDTLATGEQQPRLPGDVGAVREQDVATPEFHAPFALTSEVAKAAKPRAEPGPSPGYVAASEAANAASERFREAQRAYRAREIDDAAFLAARDANTAAADRYDAAFAKEQARADRTSLFQDGTPITGETLGAFEDAILTKYGSDLERFELGLNRNGDIALEWIIVDRGAQRAGLGSDVMRDLTRFADQHGRRLVLSPAEGADAGGPVREKLITFYKRFGFVENTDRQFDPSVTSQMYRDATEPGRALQQEPGRRGVIRFGPDRQFSINLLERADLSTFLHESGHFFLEVLTDLADQLGAIAPDARTEQQAQLLGDHAALLEWLTDEDHTGAGFSVKQHEQFARGFEAYLMEGKAPSAELRTPFARFRAWLTGIYRSLKSLNVHLTDDVRGVMDRLLASDQAIADAQAQRGVEAMFSTPESAGMEPSEFALYARTIADASKDAREQLDRKLLAEVQREQTREWKEQRANIRVDVENAVHQRPEYRALAAMREGTHPDGSPLVEGLETPPLVLDRALLEQRFGPDRVKRLPRGIVSSEGGVDPDLVATMFGYSSADELLRAVEKAPPMKAVIDQEAKRRMIEEHGSILLDGSLAEKAQASVANETRDEVIRAEMRALGRKRREVAPFVKAEKAKGEAALQAEQAERDYERRWFEAEAKLRIAIAEGHKQIEIDALTAEVQGLRAKARGGAAVIRNAIPPAAALRDAAQARIAAMPIRQIKPQVFWSASRRAGQQALERAARQDFDGAITAKQQELINLNLYRQAEQALEDVTARARFAQGLGTKAVRATLGYAGDSYLDQVDGVLDRFEFAKVSPKVLDRRAGLRHWIAALEAQGLPADGIPVELLEDAQRRNWKELTVDQLVGVTDGLKQILHLARLKNRLLKAADAREFGAVRDGIVASVDQLPKRPTQLEFRPSDDAARTVQEWFASHSKLSTIVRALDGHQDGGPLWEAISRPINAAGDAEVERKKVDGERYAKVLEAAYPGNELGQLHEKQFIPEIGGSLSKEARLAVALNWGNETSRSRLLNDPTRRWKEPQIAAILETLDARDWTFVQDTWDFVNSYWDEIAAKQERVTGIAPEKVEPLPVATKFGEVAGGYYPLAYDGRLSVRVGQHEMASATTLAAAGNYVRSTTARGHVEARKQNVKLPIRLELGVMFSHLDQVIHDLTHHETLIDTTRILRDPKVSAAIIATKGDITYRQMTSALQDIAVGSMAGKNIMDRAANYARTGTQLSMLGWNLWTAAQQPLGLFNGMSRVGPTWVARGMKRWLRDAASMENTAKWIADVSPMMRDRTITATQDLADLRTAIRQPGGWFDSMVRKVSADHLTQQTIVDGYMWHIGLAQRVADIPTWLGGYEKAMAGPREGRTPEDHEARAIALADQGVLDSQGGGQIKDLAQIQRGGPIAKLFMTFYSYGNTVFNATADRAGATNFRSPAEIATFLGHLSLLYLLPALGTVALSRASGRSGPKDDSVARFAGDVGQEILSTGLNTMVLVRELGGLVQDGTRGYAGPAGARLAELLYNVANQAKQGKADVGLFKATNAAAGVLFRYPALQVQRTIDGWTALQEGRTSNPAALLVGAPPKNVRK